MGWSCNFSRSGSRDRCNNAYWQISIFGASKENHSDQGANFEFILFPEIPKEIHSVQKTNLNPCCFLKFVNYWICKKGEHRLVRNRTAWWEDLTKPRASINLMQRNWNAFLSIVMMAYRSSVQESIKVSPSCMMLGREISLLISIVLGEIQQVAPRDLKSDNAYQLTERWRVHMTTLERTCN